MLRGISLGGVRQSARRPMLLLVGFAVALATATLQTADPRLPSWSLAALPIDGLAAAPHAVPVYVTPYTRAWFARQFDAGGALTGVNTAVAITTPTSAPTYDAGTASTVALAGTASSDRPVTGCTWTNSLGGSGAATGTSAWAIASVALTVGSNVVTVTCANAGGGTPNVATLTVTRQPAAAGRQRYLKADCAFNGNGQAATCAASAGASGAWNSVDNANTGWTASCLPDDTLYIRALDDGTEHIASGNSDNARYHGGLRFPCSGTSGHPVTVTNYPGEVARIANGVVGCTLQQCDNSTITTAERDYARVGCTDGFYGTSGRLVVRGIITVHGVSSANRAQGIVICGVEATQGWDDDGNWAPIRIDFTDAAWIHHNYLHDVILTDGGAVYCTGGTPGDRCNASSGTGIKIFTGPDTIAEYNTIQRVCVTANCGPNGQFASQAGGIDDKADAVRSIYRYNYIEDVNVCFRFQNQTDQFAASTGVQVYGNVCARVGTVVDGADHGSFVTENAPITDLLVHHNTFSGFGLNFVGKGAITAGGFTWRDNVIAAVAGGSPANRNIWDDGSAFALSAFSASTNNNAYDSDADYQTDGTFTTIAAWRTALGSGKESASTEAATTCGTAFIAGTDTNFHIDPVSACKTGSSTGGEQGAYGATSCVGHLCTN